MTRNSTQVPGLPAAKATPNAKLPTAPPGTNPNKRARAAAYDIIPDSKKLSSLSQMTSPERYRREDKTGKLILESKTARTVRKATERKDARAKQAAEEETRIAEIAEMEAARDQLVAKLDALVGEGDEREGKASGKKRKASKTPPSASGSTKGQQDARAKGKKESKAKEVEKTRKVYI